MSGGSSHCLPPVDGDRTESLLWEEDNPKTAGGLRPGLATAIRHMTVGTEAEADASLAAMCGVEMAKASPEGAAQQPPRLRPPARAVTWKERSKSFHKSVHEGHKNTKEWFERRVSPTRGWWGKYDDSVWFVVDPEAKWRACWDAATGVLLLYLVFAIPYSIAFLDKMDMAFELFILIWFTVDIVLSFVTPYEKAGLIVTNPKWIAYEYGRTYFLIDFVSTFPFDYIFDNSAGGMNMTGKALKLPKLAKTLRALKMSKLMKFYQIDEMLGQVQINFRISPAFINLLALIFAALVVNHMFACIWYMIGVKAWDPDCADGGYNRRRRHCTWMQSGGFAPRDGNWYLYTTCLYWSLSTVSTVGYGDISANTTTEKTYTILVMITGVAGYAMLLQSIGQLMSTQGSPQSAATNALRNYLYKRNVPLGLSSEIFDYLYRHNAIRAFNNDHDAGVVQSISELPKPVRRKLRLFTERFLIKATPWFHDKSADFVADAITHLRPTLCTRGEVVGARCIRAEALFFVVAGKLAVYPEGSAPRRVSKLDWKDGTQTEADSFEPPRGRSLLDFGPRDTFGAPGCFLDASWTHDIIAETECEINVLPRVQLRRLLDEPEHAAILPLLQEEARVSVDGAAFLYHVPAKPNVSANTPSRTDSFSDVASLAGDEPSPRDRDRRADARADSAANVAAFLRKHVPEAALDSDEPGADVVRGLVALGNFYALHDTRAQDALSAVAQMQAGDTREGDARSFSACMSMPSV